MFNDDITPEAVGALLADLSLMLATEEAVSRVHGPVAHVQTEGTRRKLSIQQVGGLVFLWCGKAGMACVFERDEFGRMLATLDEMDEDEYELLEDDGGRSIHFSWCGDILSLSCGPTRLRMDYLEFRDALVRAELAARA